MVKGCGMQVLSVRQGGCLTKCWPEPCLINHVCLFDFLTLKGQYSSGDPGRGRAWPGEYALVLAVSFCGREIQNIDAVLAAGFPWSSR